MAAVAGTHYVLGAVGVITPPYEPPVQIVSGASVVDHMGISRFSREPRFAGWGGSAGKGKGGGAASELTPLLPAAAPAKGDKVEGVRKMPADSDDRARPAAAQRTAPQNPRAVWRRGNGRAAGAQRGAQCAGCAAAPGHALTRAARCFPFPFLWCRVVLDRQRAVLAGDVCDHEAHDGVRGHAVPVEHVVAAGAGQLFRDVHDAHVLRLLWLPQQGHAHAGALPARAVPRLGALRHRQRVLQLDRQRLGGDARHVHQRAGQPGGVLVPVLLDSVAPHLALHLRLPAVGGHPGVVHAVLVQRLLVRQRADVPPGRGAGLFSLRRHRLLRAAGAHQGHGQGVAEARQRRLLLVPVRHHDDVCQGDVPGRGRGAVQREPRQHLQLLLDGARLQPQLLLRRG